MAPAGLSVRLLEPLILAHMVHPDLDTHCVSRSCDSFERQYSAPCSDKRLPGTAETARGGQRPLTRSYLRRGVLLGPVRLLVPWVGLPGPHWGCPQSSGSSMKCSLAVLSWFTFLQTRRLRVSGSPIAATVREPNRGPEVDAKAGGTPECRPAGRERGRRARRGWPEH